MNDVFVRYKDMPCTVPAFTKEDSEGDFNVYINAQLSYEEQQLALDHERRHIEYGDFDSEIDLRIAESRAG